MGIGDGWCWTENPSGRGEKWAMRRAATGLLIAACLSSGCDLGGRTGDPAVGQALYLELCLDCHGDYGELSAKKRSRPLRDLTADEIMGMLRKYQKVTDDTPWWAEFKSGLTDAQIGDLLAYLGTLQGGHTELARGN
ncbi:c-type cytochrome [Thiocystis violascens]|uniref:Cytochrome c553 n=1 Tax=Thiocystis violascens (strain ATCC 17096 / DSM 198 / 6111) TaxID=765911 RepID=I3Y5F1_THIV6|nr:c-type cytochrome [Thiocystis violascens]AFL72219.1 cytochrome c553 [Thiocystis violascens DSM 198]